MMTPQMLNTIPQAASLGPQNNSDGMLSECLKTDKTEKVTLALHRLKTSRMADAISKMVAGHLLGSTRLFPLAFVSAPY